MKYVVLYRSQEMKLPLSSIWKSLKIKPVFQIIQNNFRSIRYRVRSLVSLGNHGDPSVLFVKRCIFRVNLKTCLIRASYKSMSFLKTHLKLGLGSYTKKRKKNARCVRMKNKTARIVRHKRICPACEGNSHELERQIQIDWKKLYLSNEDF